MAHLVHTRVSIYNQSLSQRMQASATEFSKYNFQFTYTWNELGWNKEKNG